MSEVVINKFELLGFLIPVISDDVAVLRSELQNVQKIMVEDIGEKKEKKLDDLRSENEGLKIEVAKLNQDSQSKNTQWNQQVSQLEGNSFISKL